MKRIVSISILVCFVVTSIMGPDPVYAQPSSLAGGYFRLPEPGVMVHLSPPLEPPILKGIKVHPDNPFRFDFILDKGDFVETPLMASLQDESKKLIKYFLASLTIPEKDLWVNLSPYEKDRIIPQSFGLTEMGRDLLAEDYMLKQVTASLIYPEGETGKKFWKRVYEEAQKKFGTTNIPVNTFNKVWIVPEKAVVYENAKAGTAYVVESKLKVMLEQDYLAMSKNMCRGGPCVRPNIRAETSSAPTNDINSLGSKIIREIVIPELTKEVNENKNFAQLRQVYNSLILATWYKKKIKDSILEQVYADKNKVAGVNIDDPQEKQRIYERYLKAFKKGVYNYIKEEVDPATQETVPRKYFSGGFFGAVIDSAMVITDRAQTSWFNRFNRNALILVTAGILAAANVPAQEAKPTPISIVEVENDFMAKYDIGAQRIKFVLDPQEYQRVLAEKVPMGAWAVGFKKADQEHFDLYVRLMGFKQKPATVNELMGNGLRYDLTDILSRLGTLDIDQARERVLMFEQLFQASDHQLAARLKPEIFIDFWDNWDPDDIDFLKQVIVEYPDLLRPGQLERDVNNQEKISNLMAEIRRLGPLGHKIVVATPQQKYLLRRYFLDILLYFRYTQNMDDEHRLNALVFSILATLTDDFDGMNADHTGKVGYKIAVNRALPGIIAHEQGHNISPIGSNENIILNEMVGDVYAGSFEQDLGMDLNLWKTVRGLENKIKRKLILQRAISLIKGEGDPAKEEHYFARLQERYLRETLGKDINKKALHTALVSMEEDYQAQRLDDRLTKFINFSFDAVKEGDQFEFDRFTIELLNRYFKIIGKPMPTVRTTQVQLRVVSQLQGPYVLTASEFGYSLSKIKELIAEISKDVHQPMPAIRDVQSGVDWLNHCIGPYQMYFKKFDTKELKGEIKPLILKIQNTYKVESVAQLSAEQLTQLAMTDDGKTLKRFILELYYSEQMPDIRNLTIRVFRGFEHHAMTAAINNADLASQAMKAKITLNDDAESLQNISTIESSYVDHPNTWRINFNDNFDPKIPLDSQVKKDVRKLNADGEFEAAAGEAVLMSDENARIKSFRLHDCTAMVIHATKDGSPVFGVVHFYPEPKYRVLGNYRKMLEFLAAPSNHFQNVSIAISWDERLEGFDPEHMPYIPVSATEKDELYMQTSPWSERIKGYPDYPTTEERIRQLEQEAENLGISVIPLKAPFRIRKALQLSYGTNLFVSSRGFGFMLFDRSMKKPTYIRPWINKTEKEQVQRKESGDLAMSENVIKAASGVTYQEFYNREGAVYRVSIHRRNETIKVMPQKFDSAMTQLQLTPRTSEKNRHSVAIDMIASEWLKENTGMDLSIGEPLIGSVGTGIEPNDINELKAAFDQNPKRNPKIKFRTTELGHAIPLAYISSDFLKSETFKRSIALHMRIPSDEIKDVFLVVNQQRIVTELCIHIIQGTVTERDITVAINPVFIGKSNGAIIEKEHPSGGLFNDAISILIDHGIGINHLGNILDGKVVYPNGQLDIKFNPIEKSLSQGIDLVEFDALNPNDSLKGASVIMVNNVLMHLTKEEGQLAIRNLGENLIPGGVLIINDYIQNQAHFTIYRKEGRGELKEMGFCTISARTGNVEGTEIFRKYFFNRVNLYRQIVAHVKAVPGFNSNHERIIDSRAFKVEVARVLFQFKTRKELIERIFDIFRVKLSLKIPYVDLDDAMISQRQGGIDFTKVRIQNRGGEIKFHMDPAMLKQLQNAPGFVPVIISIKPMDNIRLFLGLDAMAASGGHGS